MGGVRENEEAALDGVANEDLAHATDEQAAALSAAYLGRPKRRLNANDRHEIAARMARRLEAKERDER